MDMVLPAKIIGKRHGPSLYFKYKGGLLREIKKGRKIFMHILQIYAFTVYGLQNMRTNMVKLKMLMYLNFCCP